MIPRILALDTTHEFGSLALASGASVLEELLLHSREGFAHLLFGHIEQLLGRHGTAIGEVDCFAAASGPGAFTGVRVGLACIKGLAEATRKPAVAVSNLAALAGFGTRTLRGPLIDARRGEIYGAVYDSSGLCVQAESVSRLDRWLETVPQGDIEFVAMDPELFRASLPGSCGPIKAAPRGLAGSIARIAYRRLLTGAALDPADLEANYVRRSDAELHLGE